MKTLTINESKLTTASLPQLLKGFEQCVDQVFKSRAMMFKIVSEIDTRNLLSKKTNYTKKQLKQLESKGITSPWNETTRTIMVNLYSHFSWSQYVKFGMLSNSIPMEVAERVSEDALILLNKRRDSIKVLLPSIRKTKGVITREEIQNIIDVKIKTPVKKVTRATATEVKSTKVEVTRLTKALSKSVELNKKLNDEVKGLRKENKRLTRLAK